MIENLSKKLEFYLDNNIRTVLIEGHMGIGKTQIIKDLWNKRFGKGKWRYYSGSTMDPFIDLQGCPIKTVDEKSNKEYLKMVKPKDWANDEVEAVLIDEYNRSKTEVRNCIMELIQFSSMNGEEFRNLKYVWAIVNPDDGSYQVDEIDNAQRDRFKIQITVPYEVSKEYFNNKYPEIADPAIEWWDNLPKDLKMLVSPRRLDYALEFYLLDGDIYDVLNEKTNPSKLVESIKAGSYKTKFLNLINKDKNVIEEFLSHPNNFFNLYDFIINNYPNFIDCFPEENISNLISSNKKVFENVMSNLDNGKFYSIVQNIIKANSNTKIVEDIKKNSEYIEYCFILEERNNPERIKIENEICQINNFDKALDAIEKNKYNLIGSKKIIDHLDTLLPLDFDINKNETIFFILNEGI